MTAVQVYPAGSGGWIYEVWFQARLIVVGWCRTREAAERQGRMV
jgi:hypothetical protein